MESINKLAGAPNMRPTHQAIMTLHGEQQANRKFMIGGLFLIMAFSAATFGLTLGAAEFSKESSVSSDGALLVKGSDTQIQTASLPNELKPLSPEMSIADIATLSHVVAIQVERHEIINESIEALVEAKKEDGKLHVTTSKATYTVPSGSSGMTLWYSAEKTGDMTAEIEEGTDKRAQICKVVAKGVLKCVRQGGHNSPIPTPEANMADTCITSEEGDTIEQCCDIDVDPPPGYIDMGQGSPKTTAVCSYVCTEVFSWWPKIWVAIEASDCGYDCCIGDATTDPESASCMSHQLSGTGSGTGSGGDCGSGNTNAGDFQLKI